MKVEDSSMIKVGITGGIGTGKTMISSIISKIGYPIFISDEEAKKAIEKSEKIKSELKKLFGEDIYLNNKINKTKLSQIIFNDTEKLNNVNRIVHPEVMKIFDKWCNEAGGNFVFFESAILFEAGLNTQMDFIICVDAPMETRIRRVITRDNTTEEKIIARIHNQMKNEDKCNMSDFIINNSSDTLIIPQIIKALNIITNLK